MKDRELLLQVTVKIQQRNNLFPEIFKTSLHQQTGFMHDSVSCGSYGHRIKAAVLISVTTANSGYHFESGLIA